MLCLFSVFPPESLRAVRVLISPLVCPDGWAGWWVAGKVCPAFISETIRCRKFILGREIG